MLEAWELGCIIVVLSEGDARGEQQRWDDEG